MRARGNRGFRGLFPFKRVVKMSFVKTLEADFGKLAGAATRFFARGLTRKSKAPEKATTQQPPKQMGLPKNGGGTIKTAPPIPRGVGRSDGYDWRNEADNGTGGKVRPRPEIDTNGGMAPPNMIVGNDGESYVATSFEDRVRPPGTTNAVVLPVFTDLGTVARLPNNDGSNVQALDKQIVSDIPFAGTFFNAFGGLEMHDNAAGLSAQQIAFIKGPGSEYAIATGGSGPQPAGGVSSATIAADQRKVIDRMNAVENKDGSKEVFVAGDSQNKEEYNRVGGKSGRAQRSDFEP